MCTNVRPCQTGLTLIELVMFIAIVSIGIAGILLVLNRAIQTGADPVVRKQVLAIADSLLEEVELMPFTYCDPDDPQALTATNPTVGPTGCSTAANIETTSPQAGETRYSTSTPFDNVGDYGGFTMNGGIQDITNTTISGLNNYSASVAVVQEALAGIAATESLRITVTVTGPGNTTVTLDGYRTRYAPNTTP